MDNNYICITCNKSFKLKTDLKRHENKKNKCNINDLKLDGKKIYKCNDCDKIFTLKYNYLSHINKIKKCIKKDNIDVNNEDKNINKDIIII